MNTNPSKTFMNYSRPADNCPSRAAIWLFFISIIIITGIIYGKTAWFDFVNFDDSDYVTQNLHVQAGLTWEGVRWAFTTFHGSNWFPVTWLSHMIDSRLFGSWPGGHHLSSVLLHGINSLLLASLLFRMTGAWWKSCLVATLFALHPLHVESVAWVSERKDVLSTFFFLCALFAYVRYTAHRSLPRYLAIMLLFALGLMAKPMLVSFPLVLLLLDWWPLQRFPSAGFASISLSTRQGVTGTLRPLVLEKIPLLLMSAASSIITILAQKQGEAIVSTSVLPLFQRTGRMCTHYCWYMGKLVWPSDLAFYYPIATTAVLWELASATIFIAAISVLIFRKALSLPFLVTGGLWFIITLLPVIGLVAVGMQGTADRYAYIPSIGFFIAVVWLTDELLRKTNCRKELIILLATIILGILTLLSWRQVDVWRNSTSLSEHAVKVTKDNYVAMTILGDALDDAGQSAEATGYYTRALQIRPEYEVARNSLGVVLCKQGRTDEAMNEFSTAVRLRPSYADALVNMGICMWGVGKNEEAANFFRAALQKRSDHFAALMYLKQVMSDANSPKSATWR